MGGFVGKGFPNQAASASLFENLNQPDLGQAADGQRGIPGGPTLPVLPRNPLATTARRIGKTQTSLQRGRMAARCKPAKTSASRVRLNSEQCTTEVGG